MKPNVILFFADTLTKQDISSLGGNLETPNIDRLSKGGMTLKSVQPNSPVCSPARYNLLTGRYASRAEKYKGLYSKSDPIFIRWNVYLDNNEKTLAHLYQKEGYSTALCGKWHLGEPPLEEFTSDDTKNNHKSIEKVKRNYQACQQFVRDEGGFSYVEALFSNNELAIPMPKDMPCQHNQHWITDKAVEFINSSSDKPFFLFLTPNLPHYPHVLDTLESESKLTPNGFLDKISDIQPSYRSILDRLEKAGYPKKPKHNTPEWFAKDHAAAIMWLDDSVGAVLDALEKSGKYDDTLIVFTTDHLARGKMTLHRQELPSFIQWPNKIEPGSSNDLLISHVDMVKTIIDLSGHSKEASKMNVGIDGKSFAPQLSDNTVPWENEIFSEVSYTRGIFTKDYNYIATRFPEGISRNKRKRTDVSQEGLRTKTIRFQADTTFPGYFNDDQLYNHAIDKEEQNNLNNNNDYKELLSTMKKKLATQLSDLPFTFGEFTKEIPLPRIQRGEENPQYLCQNCNYIGFSKEWENCPVCNSNNTPLRDDTIFYTSEEKYAGGVELQVPTIIINKNVKVKDGYEIEVTNPSHPMSDTFQNFIAHYDFYIDSDFIERREFIPNSVILETFSIPKGTSRAKIVAYNRYYGHYQQEIQIKK